MEVGFCFICLKVGNHFERTREKTFLHEDGKLLNPLNTLLKLIADDINVSTVDENAKCCEGCSDDLLNLAILERNLHKLKEEILSKLKSTAVKTEDATPTKLNLVEPSKTLKVEEYVEAGDDYFAQESDSNTSVVEVEISETDIGTLE